MRNFILLIFAAAALLSCSKSSDTFENPILAGFYPDPSICKAGEDYYLVTSTFVYFPGLPVFHSKDLVNWKLVGHVLHEPEWLTVEGSGVSRGLFAPSIRFHEGKFYVTCTLIDRGGNFISTATNPAGPWSAPAYVPEVDGIDPSPFFDDDGKAYILYNSVAPDNKPLYDGHRTIRLREMNADSLTVAKEETILVNGGVDINKKPVWIEAPHIIKKDGWYYLICAEGGTAYDHSEVVFRSKAVKGPYVPYEKNPILTQRHLDPARPYPITTTGHADFVETRPGEWWAVFLGCRPYAGKDFYNIGRETFLAPVEWIEGWPVINPDHEEVQYNYPLPLDAVKNGAQPLTGPFVYEDQFNDSTLGIEWMFLRAPGERWYDLASKPGTLEMKVRPETSTGTSNPSFLGHRQQHINSEVIVSIDFTANSSNEKAGLLAFQSEHNYYFLCKSVEDGKNVVQLFQAPVRGDTTLALLASRELTGSSNDVQLKFASTAEAYTASFSQGNGEWVVFKNDLDPKYLSTRVAGGFVGTVYAMYATSQGEPSTNSVRFDSFRYSGEDRRK